MDKSKYQVQLTQLLAADCIPSIEKFIRHPQGLLVVSGKTCSGKTTVINEIVKQHNQFGSDAQVVAFIDGERAGIGNDDVEKNINAVKRFAPSLLVLDEIHTGRGLAIAVDFVSCGHGVIASLHCHEKELVKEQLRLMMLQHFGHLNKPPEHDDVKWDMMALEHMLESHHFNQIHLSRSAVGVFNAK